MNKTTAEPRPLLQLQGEPFVVVETIFALVALTLDYLRLAEQLAPWPSLLRETQIRLAKLITVSPGSPLTFTLFRYSTHGAVNLSWVRVLANSMYSRRYRLGIWRLSLAA